MSDQVNETIEDFRTEQTPLGEMTGMTVRALKKVLSEADPDAIVLLGTRNPNKKGNAFITGADGFAFIQGGSVMLMDRPTAIDAIELPS